MLNPNFYKPGPPDFKIWAKPGAADDEVMRAMLECSGRSPVGRELGETSEEIALAQRCMLKDGFNYVGQFKPSCELDSYREYSACAPDAIIPKRDPQRRLNSQFCKTNSTWKICQPGS
jgi:hypothetical protein